MKHLTTTQFLQFIDGSLDYASQAQCTSHLAICEKCRKEVELQKFIAKESHRQPIVRTSPRFAQSVMTRILPHPEKSWRAHLIDNLGNLLAMATVLAVLGYAIMNPALFSSPQQTSQQTLIPQSVSDTYQGFMSSLSLRASAAMQRLSASTGTESNKVISLTLLSLAILIAFDQFVLKKYMGLKTRR